jgi:diadenosine tetraphosphate (Ap4A) HIT family hydrolase
MALDGSAQGGVAGCTFCSSALLADVLAETPRFRVVADIAPLVEGHVLIMPREHFACYGAVPVEYEAELVALKRRVARFFRGRYRPAIFFEHGVFRQTVFHAHLHAFPFGRLDLALEALGAPDGRPVQSLADLQAWYREHGHYFYLEQPRTGDEAAVARVFPPDEERYFRALGALRAQSESLGHGGFRPALVRRLQGGPQIAALAAAWREFEQQAVTAAPPPDGA